MSEEILKLVSDAMESLGIEYAFETYEGKPEENQEERRIVYPYFVGSYTEPEPSTEDGLQEPTFMLTGFSRDTWLTLIRAKKRIENHFDPVGGMTVITDNGSGVAIFYAGSLPVPTGDAELKSIQINLSIKEWKVTT